MPFQMYQDFVNVRTPKVTVTISQKSHTKKNFSAKFQFLTDSRQIFP
jgi:hypothetical protein